ncbi:DNA gyrase inhibitor YacG [Panacagrimonas sp.]|uniref:DNA gyrase inhibitor YacG n=1 Tax=Panacagrimonas sp. TaxID=2480088 RepID=UPI003B527D92
MTAHKTAACPQCRQPSSLEKSNRFRPFCSERCKLLDLGEWFAEKHSIPVSESDSEIEDAVPRTQDSDRLQ